MNTEQDLLNELLSGKLLETFSSYNQEDQLEILLKLTELKTNLESDAQYIETIFHIKENLSDSDIEDILKIYHFPNTSSSCKYNPNIESHKILMDELINSNNPRIKEMLSNIDNSNITSVTLNIEHLKIDNIIHKSLTLNIVHKENIEINPSELLDSSNEKLFLNNYDNLIIQYHSCWILS